MTDPGGLSEAEKKRLYEPSCDCKFCQRYRKEHGLPFIPRVTP